MRSYKHEAVWGRFYLHTHGCLRQTKRHMFEAVQHKAVRSLVKMPQSTWLYLVSSTPSLILHFQAGLKSGAGTQQSSSPDSCTSSSWAISWPFCVSSVKTLSEILKGEAHLNICPRARVQYFGSWVWSNWALTWSLIPVAMWPTFTRRVSLIRMLLLLKSLMQTSTPEPATNKERHMTYGERGHVYRKSACNALHLTFKTTWRW